MIGTGYDPEADVTSVWFAPPGMTAAETEEVAPGVNLDFDADGQVIGIEVLGVRRRTRSAGPAAVARTAAE
jgi:uncharacterized protein YuzE